MSYGDYDGYDYDYDDSPMDYGDVEADGAADEEWTADWFAEDQDAEE